MTLARHFVVSTFLFCSLCLIACSPTYNWREVHGKDAPFVVLLPAKPVTLTREINLDGMRVNMTMTAAEVDGVNFAVGYVVVADTERTSAAMNALKTALVANINGHVKPAEPGAVTDVEAHGFGGNDGQALLLLGHFEAKDHRIYQVIVLGNEKAVSRDEAKTFFSSFKII